MYLEGAITTCRHIDVAVGGGGGAVTSRDVHRRLVNYLILILILSATTG
jgi:hypothetical protein